MFSVVFPNTELFISLKKSFSKLLAAVDRGISFYQSSWMESYIRKNTELRKTAANSIWKNNRKHKKKTKYFYY